MLICSQFPHVTVTSLPSPSIETLHCNSFSTLFFRKQNVSVEDGENDFNPGTAKKLKSKQNPRVMKGNDKY